MITNALSKRIIKGSINHAKKSKNSLIKMKETLKSEEIKLHLYGSLLNKTNICRSDIDLVIVQKNEVLDEQNVFPKN